MKISNTKKNYKTSITLSLDEQTQNRFNKLLNFYGDNYSMIINAMIDYRINELKKGIRNIELDILVYEKKYEMKSSIFYKKYQQAHFEENSHENDFMIWSGIYETYQEFKNELKQIV